MGKQFVQALLGHRQILFMANTSLRFPPVFIKQKGNLFLWTCKCINFQAFIQWTARRAKCTSSARRKRSKTCNDTWIPRLVTSHLESWREDTWRCNRRSSTQSYYLARFLVQPRKQFGSSASTLLRSQDPCPFGFHANIL